MLSPVCKITPAFLSQPPTAGDSKLGDKPTTTFKMLQFKEIEEIGLDGCGGVLKSATAGSYQHDGWVDGGISQC